MKVMESEQWKFLNTEYETGKYLWENIKDYRIVMYPCARLLSPKTDNGFAFFLLQKTNWMWNWLDQWRWELCCLCDIGYEQPDNYVALTSDNPLDIIARLGNVIHTKLSGVKVPFHGRDSIPKFSQVKELNLTETLWRLMNLDIEKLDDKALLEKSVFVYK